MSNRKYDIILFGATGFTGQITAEYLSQHAVKENISWAIAGRNKEKLEQVHESITGLKPSILVADINSPDSLNEIISQGYIVMNAAGPFVMYGLPVVKACVQTFTHYLDITGEPSFVAQVYDDYFYKAEAQKICIVNCCGFDSIPADYAAWLTAKELPNDAPKSLYGFVRTNATFSGGTLTTAVNAIHNDALKVSYKTKIPKHPNAPKIPLKIHFNKDINAWALPMPVVDPHIIKRGIYRLPQDYGQATSYAQFWLSKSFMKMFKTVLSIGIGMMGIKFKPFREMLLKKFKPGTGPSPEKRARTKFEVICIGKSGEKTVKTVFSGADPGYDETAKMFSQSAFVINEKIKNQTLKYGVLTPVEALGNSLVLRLIKEGIKIDTYTI